MLKETIAASTIDGNGTSSGTRSVAARADETIEPQLGVGGWAQEVAGRLRS
jgi:hypothetical protein